MQPEPTPTNKEPQQWTDNDWTDDDDAITDAICDQLAQEKAHQHINDDGSHHSSKSI